MKVALIGFLGIGFLLLTDHWGMAIKVTNYVFYALLVLMVYEKITNRI